jgi:hypothetical protein
MLQVIFGGRHVARTAAASVPISSIRAKIQRIALALHGGLAPTDVIAKR